MKDICKLLREADLTGSSSLPFWSWNNDLQDEELLAQIRAMKDVGIDGFIMHARTGLRVDYLSERWFHCIELCLDEARALGMHALIYDENGWPSGFAGGLLLKNPENLAQFLRYQVLDHFDFTAFAVYQVTDGVAERLKAPRDGLTQYHCLYLHSSPANTDILNPQVVQQFLDCTYEAYYARFSGRFGRELWGFFTDEPQFYRWETPYTRVMAPIWQDRYGADLRDGLVYLFLHSPAGYGFRCRYYGLLNELYVQNYYGRLFRWCRERGCHFTGHSIEESTLHMQMWGSASVTPTYEFETIPAIDHLGRIPAASLSAKQVGSAAQQLGKPYVLTETFGCCGWDTTPRELRCIAEAQYVRGVNLMCQHLSSYSLSGQGKVDYPPSFSRHNTWWKEYGVFNRYFTRLGYLLSHSRELVNTLVLNPMSSIWLDYVRSEEESHYDNPLDRSLAELQAQLSAHAITCHLGDEQILARHGRIEDGKFLVGQCAYNSIILPRCLTLLPSTKKLLQDFLAVGGPVYLYDEPPLYTGGEPDDYSFLTERLADHYDEIYAAEALPLRVSGPLPFTCREGEGFRLLFLVNEGTDFVSCTLPAGNFCTLDLITLETHRARSSYTLEPGQSLLLLQDAHAGPAEPVYAGEVFDLTDRLTFVRSTDNALPLDQVRISFDGVTFDQPHDVHEVFDRLVLADYQGDLWVRYEFTVRELPDRLLLRAECSRQQDLTLNGRPLTLGPSPFDVLFQEAEVGPLLQLGANVLQYRVRWFQSPQVRYALFDPEATESLRNCLVYDTEIEPVQLLGPFRVAEDRALLADGPTRSIRDLTADGYKFFCGSQVFTVRFPAKAARARLELEGRYMVCGVRVNGTDQPGSILSRFVSLTLVPGVENELELTVTSSLRNLFGPHHLGCEPMAVSPMSFTMRTTWKNGTSPDYHPGYTTVPFGLTAVWLRYEA